MIEFPPVEMANDEGMLCWGGNLQPETLCTAYRNGIFPWPIPGQPLWWFAPPQRALLFLEEFHISRSTKKLLRGRPWEVRFDTNFPAVISACRRAPRPGQGGTWITNPIVAAYTRLHELGIAHSVETYLEGELVGGLYGVGFGKYFAGESMFQTQTGASKIALIHLVEHLKAQGTTWLDCQNQSPLLQSHGAREVPRGEFMEMLNEAVGRRAVLWSAGFQPATG